MQQVISRMVRSYTTASAIIVVTFAKFFTGGWAAASSEGSSAPVPTVGERAHDTYLYVSGVYRDEDKGYIRQFRVSPNGTLVPLNPPVLKAAFTPRVLVSDPAGKFVYVTDGGDKIVAYRVQTNGALASLHSPLVSYRESSIDPSTKSVVPAGANFITSMTFRPDGKFLYAVIGAGDNWNYQHGRVIVFRRTFSGSLVEVRNAGLRGLEAPLSIAFSPQGDSAYVLQYGRWVNGYSGHLSAYRVLANGPLRPTPAQDAVREFNYIQPDAILVSPSRHSAYVSSRDGLNQYVIGAGGLLQQGDRLNEEVVSPAMTRDGETILATPRDEFGAQKPAIMLIHVEADSKFSEPVVYWIKADGSIQRDPIPDAQKEQRGYAYALHISKDGEFAFALLPKSQDSLLVYSLDGAGRSLSFVQKVDIYSNPASFVTSFVLVSHSSDNNSP